MLLDNDSIEFIQNLETTVKTLENENLKLKEKVYTLGGDVDINKYGFRWGDCLVERFTSSDKNPKFKILRVYTPNGELIEILMRPRSNKITKFKKPKDNK